MRPSNSKFDFRKRLKNYLDVLFLKQSSLHCCY